MKRRKSSAIKASGILFPLLLMLSLWLMAIIIWKHGSACHEGSEQSLSVYAESPCITSADCGFNGECVKNKKDHDPEAAGQCDCFQGWTGATCEVLDVLPSFGGLQLPNHTSSWGGSVAYDSTSKRYHMFASEIVNGCGLYDWTTNSQVVRATSETPEGPYFKEQVIVPVFAHDANILRAPTGEWVLFVTARKGIAPKDCRHSNETTAVHNSTPPKDTYMLWAHRPEGPWSTPVMVLNSTKYNSVYWNKTHHIAKCDSNLNGIILPSGKFIGLWRKCETPELMTIPHLLTASDWKSASAYIPHFQHPLFPLAGSGAEDPSNIWMTATTEMKPHQIALHALFHDEQATRCMLGVCGGIGRHAVSLWDTSNNAMGAWRYSSWNAYDRHVAFVDGEVLRADTRARPHLILDHITHQPVALSTGVKETNKSGYCWTIVTPLRGSQKLR